MCEAATALASAGADEESVAELEQALALAPSAQPGARVAAGKTNKHIAAALYLSEKTIESHLARIYDKLGVHSRAALTAVIVPEGTS